VAALALERLSDDSDNDQSMSPPHPYAATLALRGLSDDDELMSPVHPSAAALALEGLSDNGDDELMSPADAAAASAPGTTGTRRRWCAEDFASFADPEDYCGSESD
jgi:hypothetical protein